MPYQEPRSTLGRNDHDWEARVSLHEGDPGGFSIDEVRNRLHGQLDIQPINQQQQQQLQQLQQQQPNGPHHSPHNALRRGSAEGQWGNEPTPPPHPHTTGTPVGKGSSEGSSDQGIRDSAEEQQHPTLPPHDLHPHQTIRHLPYNNSRGGLKPRDDNSLMGHQGHPGGGHPPPLTNGDRGRGTPPHPHWTNNNGGLREREEPQLNHLPPPSHLPPLTHHEAARRQELYGGPPGGRVSSPRASPRASPYQARDDVGRRLSRPTLVDHPTPPGLHPPPPGSPHQGRGRLTNKDIINAARTAGLPMSGIDPSDPMSALLAAAKVVSHFSTF